MGASSSKATRTLPKRVTTPPWSGARAAPRAADSLAEAASETKNNVIEEDSKDPQFLSKLSQLGPVRVDHHMQTVRTAELTKKMFDSRVQSENEAAGSVPTQNRLQASKLTMLLDERKSIRTRRDMEFLAQRFGIDLEKLDAVSKFVSTPSVQANSAVRVTSKDGQEKQIIKAVWIEPRLKTGTST